MSKKQKQKNKNNKVLTNTEIVAQTSGVRRSIYYSVLTGLSPLRLANLLRESAETSYAEEYLTLAEEMEERDAHYRAVLNTRKQQILALPIVVNSVGEDSNSKKLKEFVEDIVNKPKFKKMLFNLLDGLGKGYSVVEVEYEIKNNLWIPNNYLHRKPQWFAFNQDGSELLLREDLDTLIEIPKIQAIKHVPQLKTGLPIRGGLARAVATLFLLKNYGVKDWSSFLEVFGMPLRLGKYGPDASEDDKKKLLRAVADIGMDQAAVIPESMNIEFISNKDGGSSNNELFLSYIKYMEEQVSKVVLGQTMTTDNGSSRSQADVHNEVREDIKRADALDLAETINEYIVTLIEFNFGIQESYPSIEFNTSKAEDREVLANIAMQAVNMGMAISASDTRNRLGLKAPVDDKDVLKLNANNIDNSKTSNKDLNMEEGEEVVSNWQKIMDPIVKQVNEVLVSSNSKEEVTNKLESLSLNTEYLENDLAKETTKEYVEGLKGNK